jgi:hypothetical protein
MIKDVTYTEYNLEHKAIKNWYFVQFGNTNSIMKTGFYYNGMIQEIFWGANITY